MTKPMLLSQGTVQVWVIRNVLAFINYIMLLTNNNSPEFVKDKKKKIKIEKNGFPKKCSFNLCVLRYLLILFFL